MMRFVFLLFLLPARAEYRAFELVINDSASGQERVVISTLDPKQYRGYYPTKYTETIGYRATWRCKGNTSWKPICQRPEPAAKPKVPIQAPAPAPSLDQKSKP